MGLPPKPQAAVTIRRGQRRKRGDGFARKLPKPLIPWEELREGAARFSAALGFEDCWSANIVQAGGLEQPFGQSSSPPHLRSPLHGTPERLDTEQWAGFFTERLGDFVPSQMASGQWQACWVDEPAPGIGLGSDLRARPSKREIVFGPGAIEHDLAAPDTHQLWSAAPPEKIVQEIEPKSPGWQLQDIFATPPARAAPRTSSSSSEGIDDDLLRELTLKSNALRALRDAKLCGPGLMEELTEGVAKLNVDPKTSLMRKFLGLLSPSLLGFPTNSRPKKKHVTPKNILCMDTAVRRSERPSTKSSTMLASRRAQASACKQLGLIQREEEFNDDIQTQYLHTFKYPLTQGNIQGLAALAEVATRPAFVLPDQDMHEMLRETPTAV
jgi:hypothetical protein